MFYELDGLVYIKIYTETSAIGRLVKTKNTCSIVFFADVLLTSRYLQELAAFLDRCSNQKR